MTIRLATKADLEAIVAIYNATIPSRMATADTETISVESRYYWFEQHQPNHRPIFVSEKENKVIAWLSFQSFYGRAAYDATVEVSIYVDQNYLRQGIASKLLQYGIDCSQKLGIKTLVAFIFAHNQPSLNLFTKFGFQEWGYLPRIAELDTVERDLLILGKRISF